MNALERLGLPDGATKQEIRAAWRKLASQHHPDHGGDPTVFHELRQAYDEASRRAPDARTCAACNGTGKTKITRGFNVLTMICRYCAGKGVSEEVR